MSFFPCKAEPDIWLRDRGDHYEYIAVYTDDLLTIASKNPEVITDELEKVHKFKLKGTGPLQFLLGCDYLREEDGTLCIIPKKFITKMNDTYVHLFGEKPNTRCQSPMDCDDHPELDKTDFLDTRHTKIYQSLIGSCQWIVQLGRFDIAVHIMSLSSFCMAPRKGHLQRVKRVYGYLSKFKTGAIHFRTEMPDFSDLPLADYNWDQSPYAGSREELPKDIPTPRGKPIKIFSYADANLMHDALSGKAVTAILHFINKTPFDWFSKKQNTVNTATFGAEGDAGCTAIEQMRANKLTLLYLGVTVQGPALLFGDNKTIIDSTTSPHSKLYKRHLMLSYHYIREAIASGAYAYTFINGKDNPSDVLSKHWSYNDVWPSLQPILFMPGSVLKVKSRSRQKGGNPQTG